MRTCCRQSADKIDANINDDEAREIYLALKKELAPDLEAAGREHVGRAEFESVYTQFRGISGTPLRDSFHLGQTIVNDYGRPYEEGFNNYTGFNVRAEAGRFRFISGANISTRRAPQVIRRRCLRYLSDNVDHIPIATNPVQATIPLGTDSRARTISGF